MEMVDKEIVKVVKLISPMKQQVHMVCRLCFIMNDGALSL